MQITIHSSHAKDVEGKNYAFLIDPDGTIIDNNVDDSFEFTPVIFDVAEYIAYYGKLNGDIDVLDIGYSDGNRNEPPEWAWRKQTILDGIFDALSPKIPLNKRISIEKAMPDLRTKFDNDRAEYIRLVKKAVASDRLEYLRGEIKAERISYGEIAEVQSLVDYIEPGDVELLQWAGVPEQNGE